MDDRQKAADDMQATWTPNDLLWISTLVRRNFVFIIATSLAVLLLMFGYMVINGPTYDVSAKLLVRMGREMSTPASVDIVAGGQIGAPFKRPEDIESEVEILSNPNLITRAVDSLGADFFLKEAPRETLWQQVKYAVKSVKARFSDLTRETLIMMGLRRPTTPLERIAVSIAAGLKVGLVPKSDVIEISLGFPDPRAGEIFLTTYLDQALASHVDAHRSQKDASFFMKERETLGRELSDAERRLLAIRSQRNSIWSGPDQRALMLKAETDLQQQLNGTQADERQTAAQIDDARERVKALTPEVTLTSISTRNKAADELSMKLKQLQVDLIALRARYGDANSDIEDLKRQIETLNTMRAAEPEYRTDGVTMGRNPQYEQLVRDLAEKENIHGGQLARIKELTAQQSALREQSIAAQSLEIEMSRAESQIGQLRRSFGAYDKALEEARINDAMDATQMSNLNVIMPPTAETVPSKPSINRVLLIGGMGGFLLALALLVARDLIRRETVGFQSPA